MLLGGEIGLDSPHFAEHLRVFSDIFLRLIKVIVAPLILGTLITGIAGHGNLRGVGRIGIKSLIYFELVTTVALFIGLGAINISRAGEGMAMPATPEIVTAQNAPPMHWDDFLLHVFPENLAKSVAENQILQVAVFAILFGIALARIPEAKRAPMLKFCESLTDVMFAFTNHRDVLRPGRRRRRDGLHRRARGNWRAAAARQIAAHRIRRAGRLFAVRAAAHRVVRKTPNRPLRRKPSPNPPPSPSPPARPKRRCPARWKSMEAFGVPRRIVAFVIPAGYSFNLDGSSLYLALASVFVAQVAGIHMPFGEQLFMVFTLMLTSKGVAGVPRAVLVVLLATVGMFHLPTEPIFIILGIDALMDMARTAVNVVGNCLASAIIARWEGELGPEASTPV